MLNEYIWVIASVIGITVTASNNIMQLQTSSQVKLDLVYNEADNTEWSDESRL